MAKEVKLQKGKDVKRFYLFNDGTIKDTSGRILANFWEYHYTLVKNGYVEI